MPARTTGWSSTTSSLITGAPRAEGRAGAGFAAQQHRAPDLGRPAVDAVEPEPRPCGIRVEPAAVVTHLEHDALGVVVREREVDVRGRRVPAHVRQRLLGGAQDDDLGRPSERHRVARDPHVGAQAVLAADGRAEAVQGLAEGAGLEVPGGQLGDDEAGLVEVVPMPSAR